MVCGSAASLVSVQGSHRAMGAFCPRYACLYFLRWVDRAIGVDTKTAKRFSDREAAIARPMRGVRGRFAARGSDAKAVTPSRLPRRLFAARMDMGVLSSSCARHPAVVTWLFSRRY